MRTFEFRDGKSNKFWNIDLQGNRFTVTFGRIGTAGQSQTKEFADDAKAQVEHDKLVKEKLGKGYVETSAGAAAAAPTTKVLENAIYADPDDLAARMAYADWLSEQSEPRGEFIQVQLALEDPARSTAERKKLQQREQALLQEHRRDWLGELAPFILDQRSDVGMFQGSHPITFQHQFARGWLDSIEIPQLSLPLSRVLAKVPQARVLRRLVIGLLQEEEGEHEFEPGDGVPDDADERDIPLYPLARSANLANLRVFQLGEQLAADEFDSCYTSGGAAVDLVRKMPRLEELYLSAHGIDMEALFRLKTLQNLRVLQVYHMETGYPLATLAGNSALKNLTGLLLRPHGLGGDVPESGAYIDLAGVQAVLRSPHLKILTHLQIQISNIGDAGCTEIVQSGVLKHLKVLDLRAGCITDAGAAILAACPDLRHLELLDVASNNLTRKGIAALEAACKQVRADDQFKPGDDGYVMFGDME